MKKVRLRGHDAAIYALAPSRVSPRLLQLNKNGLGAVYVNFA